MALSNWDTMAFGNDGKPANEFVVGNASVVPYKNWLYVRDADMWCEKRQFVKDTIAHITEGDINISKFHILARRHTEQNAIFFYVESWINDETLRFCGVAGNGYYSNSEVAFDSPEPDSEQMWSGIRQETIAAFFLWLKSVAPLEYFMKINDIKRWNQGDVYLKGNIDEVATKPGEVERPIVIKLIDQMFPKEE